MTEGATTVQVYLLGRFLVLVNGRVIPDEAWRHRRKARQLFKLLLTQPRRRLPKDQAAELLWPESDPTKALTNLRSAAHAMRHTLEVDIVVIDRDTIELRPGVEIWVDADAFERAVAQSRRDADPVPLLEEADELHVGAYLPDDIYEEWSIERRETLKRAWVGLQFSLAHHSEQVGDPDRAAKVLQRVLQDDPCEERATQELMRLFLRHDRHSDGRRVYQKLVESLHDLDAEPTETTVELGRLLAGAQPAGRIDVALDAERPRAAARPAELPRGIVTFLFTDIEGSTQLWELQPEAMQAALARHDALLRETISARRGRVFKTVGDAFYTVFAYASDALATAVAAQRSLSAEPWPEVARLRVRMALHSGAAEQRDGDYFGATLNRVARLLAAGHGGQILLSRSTAELVRDALPPGVDLLDLGQYRLKDLARPEHIFEVTAPGLRTDFPPLGALEVRQDNLPVQQTPLIDRDPEVARVQELLLRDGPGIVTLTGAGGIGKTRVALQVAASLVGRFRDGVYLVALAPIGESGLVVSAIMRTLGVQETAGRPLAESLKAYLRDRQLLLVLDNFEHVLGAAPLAAELLATCPQLKILVTSRTVLHLYGELDVPIPPLAVPDPKRPPPTERLAEYEAIALFVERSVAVKPDFAVTAQNAPAVAEICARLDGLPLAIELAAARVKLLPPQAMLARLQRAHGQASLQLLSAGAHDLPPRHQTLRGAIAWSYDLLTAEEQALFRRLAVFVGGFMLEAAEAVCGPPSPDPWPPTTDALEGLASLMDHSLLQQEDDATSGEPRFAMLETIREYALERLQASGEWPAMRRRHAEYYLTLAEKGERRVTTSDQMEWFARLEAEHPNLRGALAWSLLTDEGDADLGLRLAGALWVFWFRHNYLSEGSRWLERALAGIDGATPSARAKAMVGAGSLERFRGENARAVALLEGGATLYRDLGDTAGLAWALSHLGLALHRQGIAARGVALLEESLALRRELGDEWDVARSLLNLAAAIELERDYRRAKPLLEESLTLYRRVGDTWSMGRALGYLAKVAHAEGDQDRAVAFCEEALPLSHEVGDVWGTALAMYGLGSVALARGDRQRAAALLRDSLVLRRDMGYKTGVADCLQGLGAVAGAEGRAERAARLFGAAEAMLEAVGTPVSPGSQGPYARDMEATRASLGDAAFALAWAEGRGMLPEQAVEYALEAPA